MALSESLSLYLKTAKSDLEKQIYFQKIFLKQ
jgi:hypothetical protein